MCYVDQGDTMRKILNPLTAVYGLGVVGLTCGDCVCLDRNLECSRQRSPKWKLCTTFDACARFAPKEIVCADPRDTFLARYPKGTKVFGRDGLIGLGTGSHKK